MVCFVSILREVSAIRGIPSLVHAPFTIYTYRWCYSESYWVAAGNVFGDNSLVAGKLCRDGGIGRRKIGRAHV